MSLASQVSLLATRVGNYLRDSVLPRLLPSGGATGQVLAKSSATAYAVGWTTPRYDFAISIGGKPAAGETVFRYATPVAFTLPSALAGSRGYAATTATASAAFSVRRNGTQIGTMTFAAGSSTATLAAASATAFAVGDRLELVAPSAQDATLADLSLALAGTL